MDKYFQFYQMIKIIIILLHTLYTVLYYITVIPILTYCYNSETWIYHDFCLQIVPYAAYLTLKNFLSHPKYLKTTLILENNIHLSCFNVFNI